jgi:glycosyltransferase involved in cell wall biosynthesis
MKLMVLSDRMIGGSSAYAKDTFEICTRLAQLGHKVAHIPTGFANKMGKQVFKNVLIYESGDDAFCEDVAIRDYVEFKADLLITNKEPWVFQDIYKWAINFVPICPIDHSPVSAQITSKLETAFKVIAQSRHGQRELKQNNIESHYIPLGVRTDVYRPLPKEECKKAFYLEPDSFVIGIVALNRARKMIPQMLKGYKRFLELNPDIKAHLFLWTNVMPSRPPADISVGVADVGVNLLPEIFELGLGNPPNDVRWARWQEVEQMGGLPEFEPQGKWDMVKLYNSFDVLLLCSGGEGAGKPYLEAASCGVPSVYTNYAAAPEYAGSVGIPVNAKDYVVITTPGTRYYLADIDEMAEALTKVYNADRKTLAKRCRLHAEQYDWRKVIREYWVSFLRECEEELYPKISKEGTSSWA